MLNRSRVIRFRTHYQSKSTTYRKQQSLLRSREMASKDPRYEETFRVRILNRSDSAQVGSSMRHFQTHPVHNYPRSIQAVIQHAHQFDGLQIISKCREEMLRKNHDQLSTVISYELSSAPSHSTGAHYQMQSQVAGTSKSDGARGLINGQQPQPAQTALHTFIQSPLKRDAPPHSNKQSLARRVGQTLKWRDRSHTIGRHAQWTRQYNGVRYLLQYVHWQTVHPQLASISKWEEEITNEQLAQIAQSIEHKTHSHRVVGSNLNEKLQKLQMTTTSSNHLITSLACHDYPAIRHTSTPCFQPETRQKRMCKPRYNCKFTGCMQGKRRLSIEWTSNNNQQSLCTSNGNVETLRIFSCTPRQFRSHANLYDRKQQYALTPIMMPATADNGVYHVRARARTPRSSSYVNMLALPAAWHVAVLSHDGISAGNRTG